MARKQLGTAPSDTSDAATVAYVQANKGTSSGGGGNGNVYVQQSNPGMTSPGIWWQIDASGNLVTMWVETANTATALPTSGLVNRWSASSISTSYTNGQNITALTPTTGNVNLTASATPPTYVKSGINSKPGILFNGTNNSFTYSSGDISIPVPYTLVSVIRPLDATSGNTQQVGYFSGPEMFLNGNSYGTYAGNGVVGGGTVNTSGHLFLIGIDAGGATTVSIDGTVVATGNAGTNGIANVKIGSDTNNARYFNGEIYELMTYNKNLHNSANATDLSSIKSWAQQQFGLTVA